MERARRRPADPRGERPGGTLIQASAFNGAGAVYAPTYRQSTGLAYVHDGPDDRLAIGVALSDVRAAFAEFRRRAGDRPFLLAGHSQGAALAAELLRADIAGTPLEDQLVAAYLIGSPVDAAEVPGCRAPDEVGCVVSFNARGPGHVRGVFEFRTPLAEERQLCVNPTLGRATDEAAPRTAHRGAVFLDTTTPALLPAFLASQCRGGRLVVEELQPLPAADWPSRILRRILGRENYHPVEFQLFYGDLRADAVRRADAWRAATRRVRCDGSRPRGPRTEGATQLVPESPSQPVAMAIRELGSPSKRVATSIRGVGSPSKRVATSIRGVGSPSKRVARTRRCAPTRSPARPRW